MADQTTRLEIHAKEAIEAGYNPNCLHCSYIVGRKYKLCDECLALWLEANGYNPDGSKRDSAQAG